MIIHPTWHRPRLLGVMLTVTGLGAFVIHIIFAVFGFDALWQINQNEKNHSVIGNLGIIRGGGIEARFIINHRGHVIDR